MSDSREEGGPPGGRRGFRHARHFRDLRYFRVVDVVHLERKWRLSSSGQRKKKLDLFTTKETRESSVVPTGICES